MDSGRLPVLIAGAGPTGLQLACELARYGIPFRIIDRNPAPVDTSNAVWIQPRTLELLDIQGLAAPFGKKGHRCHAVSLYAQKTRVQIPLTACGSLFPWFLIFPQSGTEKLLNERLAGFGVSVERAVQLVDVMQEEHAVYTTLQRSGGEREVLEADWLVACDGANSLVRARCQRDFVGDTLPGQCMIADVEMDSFLPQDEMHVFFDREIVCAIFPYGSRRYRVTANLHQSHPRKLFTQREVREIVHERTRGEFGVQKVFWVSPFWIHGKIIDRMQDGRIFFAGDAAHVHSPAGGQGMNAGIQDACNLAFKLALVSRGLASPHSLESYQVERYPVVSEIVRQTEAFSRMIFSRSSFGKKWREFASAAGENAAALLGRRLSQMDTCYTGSSVILYEGQDLPAGVPQPGAAAPDMPVNGGKKTLYGLLDRHLVLIFAGSGEISHTVLTLQQEVMRQYGEYARVVIVSRTIAGSAENNVVCDTGGLIHERYGMGESGMCVIRPDGYLACRAAGHDLSIVQKLFALYRA